MGRSHLAAGELALLRPAVTRLVKGNGLPKWKREHTSLAHKQCEGTQGVAGKMCFRGIFGHSPQRTPRSPRPLGEVSSKGRGLPKGCGKRLTVDHLLAEMGLRALVVGALLVDYRLVGSEGFEVT